MFFRRLLQNKRWLGAASVAGGIGIGTTAVLSSDDEQMQNFSQLRLNQIRMNMMFSGASTLFNASKVACAEE